MRSKRKSDEDPSNSKSSVIVNPKLKPSNMSKHKIRYNFSGEELFNSQKLGGKGIKSAVQLNSKRKMLMPTRIEYEQYEHSHANYNPQILLNETLLHQYESQFLHWSWLLQLKSNILLYGVGCKLQILRLFAATAIDKSDVLLLNGSHNNSIMKSLIDTITCQVLKFKVANVKETFSSLEMYARMLRDSLTKHYNSLYLKKDSASILAPHNYSNSSNFYVSQGFQFNRPPSSLSHSQFQSNVPWPKLESQAQSHSNCQSTSQSNSINSISRSSSQSNIQAVQQRSLNSITANSEVDLSANPTSTAVFDSNSNNSAVSNEIKICEKRRRSRTVNKAQEGVLPTQEIDPDWGKRYVHAKARLYILVNEIDSEAMNTKENIEVLSILASCPYVSIVATAETLNCGYQWSSQQLSNLNWTYFHTPTFTSKRLDTLFSQSNALVSEDTLSNDRFETILVTLSARHREVIELYLKLILLQENFSNKDSVVTSSSDARSAKNAVKVNESSLGNSVLYSALFKQCTSNLVLKSMTDFKAILRELNDQNILKVIQDDRKVDYIVSGVPTDVLREKMTKSKHAPKA